MSSPAPAVSADVDLSRLPHVTYVPVRFRDMDGMVHVNHAVYFTYLEVARTEYWFGLHAERAMSNINFIVLKAQCHYRSPAVLGETVVVRNGITRMGNSSFTWDYELFNQASGRWIASASTEMVMYDYQRKKPTRIPVELRQRIETWQQELRDKA